jgi:hypothetical protein
MKYESITRELFRRSLDESIRFTKRHETYRHPLVCAASLVDPFDPSCPFYRIDPLPVVERDWHFTRDSVPEYITLWTGKAARERIIQGVIDEYSLDPSERYDRIKGSAQGACHDPGDPDTWNEDDRFLCVIPVNFGLCRYWFGGRSEALTHPLLRPILLDPTSKVLHGAEAVKFTKSNAIAMTSASMSSS